MMALVALVAHAEAQREHISAGPACARVVGRAGSVGARTLSWRASPPPRPPPPRPPRSKLCLPTIQRRQVLSALGDLDGLLGLSSGRSP